MSSSPVARPEGRRRLRSRFTRLALGAGLVAGPALLTVGSGSALRQHPFTVNSLAGRRIYLRQRQHRHAQHHRRVRSARKRVAHPIAGSPFLAGGQDRAGPGLPRCDPGDQRR